MEKMNLHIIQYDESMRQNALDIALRAWAPVFPQMKKAVPGFVYDAFYPDGPPDRPPTPPRGGWSAWPAPSPPSPPTPWTLRPLTRRP